MAAIQASAFLLSALGLAFLTARTTKASLYFAPLTAASSAGLLLYAAALAGFLRPAACLLCAAGLACFSYFAVLAAQRRLRLPQPDAAALCLAAGCAAFGALTLRLRLVHYDNFSHWALIVKHLLLTDSLPDAQTGLIEFADYPPGAALLIYDVCAFLGRSQGVMLLAQNALLLTCFCAVFGVVRERRRFLLYAVLGAGCAMLSYLNLTIRINNLLVDFLLPALALAAVAAFWRYRDRPRTAAAVGAPILGLTSIVKGTGVFFAAVAFLFFFWTQLRAARRQPGGRALPCALTAAALALPPLAWQIHLRTHLAGFAGKFSAASGAQAAAEQWHMQIALDFLRTALNPAGRAAQALYLCNLLAVAAVAFARFRLGRRWKLLRLALLLDGLTALYYAGILALYLYSMPEEEALRLAGFERYACSIAALAAGGLILGAAVEIERSFAVPIDARGPYRAFSSPAAKRRYQSCVLFAVILGANFLYSEYNGLVSIQQSYAQTLPGRVRQIVGDAWPADGREDAQRYLVAASDAEGQVSSGEVRYVCRYYLYAPHVDVTDKLSAADVRGAQDKYDWIIVLDGSAVQPGAAVLGIPTEPGMYAADAQPHTQTAANSSSYTAGAAAITSVFSSGYGAFPS